jgi:hypothetical protein
MKLTPEQAGLVRAVRESDNPSFVVSIKLAGLDPATDFVEAYLRGIDFGTDGLAGFNFTGAWFQGANLSRAHGLERAIWDRAIADETTLGWPVGTDVAPPPDFRPLDVALMVMTGKTPPSAWVPFITSLDLTVDGLQRQRKDAKLTARQTVHLGKVKLTDLTPLAGLTALQTLSLSGTQVSDATPLDGLVERHGLRIIR